MDASSRKLSRLLVVVVVVVACEGWRRAWLARQAGRAAAKHIEAAWPEQGGPGVGVRERVLAVAEHLRDGQFAAAKRAVEAPSKLSKDGQELAKRFWFREPKLAQRFLAAAEAAQAEQAKGANVGAIRAALARAVVAAARKDAAAVASELQIAEATLDAGAFGAGAAAGGVVTVCKLLNEIEPAFRLGQDLMTEGHAVVAQLMARARWRVERKEYRKAIGLLTLSEQLLGLRPLTDRAAGANIDWRVDAQPLAAGGGSAKTRAQSVVVLCEATAASQPPAPPVFALIDKARREFDAGRYAEALWWGSAALKALGMAQTGGDG